MRSGIRRVAGLTITLGVAVVVSIVSLVAGAPFAFAEHETRTINVQESGVDLWIVGFTLGLVILGLILFAAVMLAWERSDGTADTSRASAEGRHPKS